MQNLIDDLNTLEKAASVLNKQASETRGGSKPDSMDDPEIKQRAQADWETLALAIGNLPSFEKRFSLMRDLYVSLPWGGIKKDL